MKWRDCTAEFAIDHLLHGGTVRNEDDIYDHCFCNEESEEMQLCELALKWEYLMEG